MPPKSILIVIRVLQNVKQKEEIKMQKAYFPMEYLRVTQKANGAHSHAGSLALDLGGKDTGKDPVYCPFDAKVVRCRENANGEMYIESTAPVLWADGTQDYMHLTLLHAESFRYNAGDVVQQGAHLYDEGGMSGGVAGAAANHLHLEVGRGHSPAYQVKNTSGTWYTPGQVDAQSALWLKESTIVLDDGGYNWLVDAQTQSYIGKWLLITADNCEYFALPDVNAPEGKLPKGDAYEIVAQGMQELGGTWVQIKEGAGLWWVLALSDRTEILDSDPSNPDGGDESEIIAQLEEKIRELEQELENLANGRELTIAQLAVLDDEAKALQALLIEIDATIAKMWDAVLTGGSPTV